MPDEENLEDLDLFIADYLYFWMESGRGVGHISVINTIVEIIYNLNKAKDDTDKINKGTKGGTKGGTKDEYVVVYVKTIQIIITYISKILIKFTTKQKQFNTISIDNYVNDVFIHNLDKWGFVSAYLPFLKMAAKDNLDKYKNEKVFNIIKDLFLFLYETSDRAITENEITDQLNAINQLVGGNKNNKKFGKNTHKHHRIQLIKKTRTRKIKKF